MQTKQMKFKHKGKEYSGNVGIPEDLSEAISVLGEKSVFNCFLGGYFEEQKRAIRSASRPRKFLKVKLADLSDDQLEALSKIGILK